MTGGHTILDMIADNYLNSKETLRTIFLKLLVIYTKLFCLYLFHNLNFKEFQNSIMMNLNWNLKN